MRHSARLRALEYFAYMPFGQKLGLAFDLLRRHILVFLGLSLLFGTAIMILLAIVAAVAGFEFLDMSNPMPPYGGYKGNGGLLLAGLMGLMFLYYYVYLGFHSLALQYINRKIPPVFGSIFSPVTDQPGGIALSFLLWLLLGFAAMAGAILIAFLINAVAPDRSVRVFMFGCVFVALMIMISTAGQCAAFYIGDCLGRGRRFRVLETVSKPIRLLGLNFWPYLGAAIFTELLYFLPPTLLNAASEALQAGGGSSGESLGLILMTFLLSACWQLAAFIFGVFFMGLTYKQAKARFLLRAQASARFR